MVVFFFFVRVSGSPERSGRESSRGFAYALLGGRKLEVDWHFCGCFWLQKMSSDSFLPEQQF